MAALGFLCDDQSWAHVYSITISTEQQLAQTISTVKEKLLSRYPTSTAQNWVLNVRTLKSTSPSSENKPSSGTQYIFRGSHLDGSSFVAIEDAEQFSAISMNSEDTEVFFRMLQEKFNTLWALKASYGLTNGASYELGDVTIRLGELRSPANSPNVRGLVCFACSHGAPEKPAMAILTDIVDTLGFGEARKYSRCWKVDDRKQELKLWCDALNQRP